MALHESAEMYLETIYVLTQARNNVRSVDVAEHMGYSKPSVSRAIGLLKQGGYVVTDGIFDRHTVLSQLLIRLGVSEETAAEDACKIEHVISDETYAAVKKYLEH